MKNSIDTIRNRTRDLPACSAVPEQTVLLRSPHVTLIPFIIISFPVYRHLSTKVAGLRVGRRRPRCSWRQPSVEERQITNKLSAEAGQNTLCRTT